MKSLFALLVTFGPSIQAQEVPADFNDARVIVLEKQIWEYHEIDQIKICEFAREFAPDKWSQWNCADYQNPVVKR